MNYLSVQNSYQRPHNTANFFYPEKTKITENNNEIASEKTLQEIWSTNNFANLNSTKPLSLNNVKMCWVKEETLARSPSPARNPTPPPPPPPPEEEEEEEEEHRPEETGAGDKEEAEGSPAHHARRPPNAFLIFCKKHRPVVRQRFPNLENRSVTKILGEWWALLGDMDKRPYSDLAKEYKDAFLTANPDFKWYKLPAPPLRTLITRPTAASSLMKTAASRPCAEFNPGKLADESQLGGLTSLMNSGFSGPPPKEESTKEKSTTVVKPPKKRFYSGDFTIEEDVKVDDNDEEETRGLVTKQDLVDKVVDGMFTKSQFNPPKKNGLKEVRKSERMCKGKRYEMFMQEGKLLSNKRDTRSTQYRLNKFEIELNNVCNNNNNIDIKKPETPKLDLGETIKRLAERTNVKLEPEEILERPKRPRTVSETSEKGASQVLFNLDLRISNLPCLGYEEFQQRKRESKKRKIRTKTEGHIRTKVPRQNSSGSQLVGSKKRKNKRSITHIGREDGCLDGGDLLGLATLAEVAANTEKINELQF